MKKVFLFLATCLLLPLSSCDDRQNLVPEFLEKIDSGERIDINAENCATYLKVHLSYEVNTDESTSLITQLTISVESSGYKELSYYIEYFSATVGYNYLSDDGLYHYANMTLSINPSNTGAGKAISSRPVIYRAIKDVRVDSLLCNGFCVVI